MVPTESREGKPTISLPQHMLMSIHAHAYTAQDSGKNTNFIVWESGRLVLSQTCGKKFPLVERSKYHLLSNKTKKDKDLLMDVSYLRSAESIFIVACKNESLYPYSSRNTIENTMNILMDLAKE